MLKVIDTWIESKVGGPWLFVCLTAIASTPVGLAWLIESEVFQLSMFYLTCVMLILTYVVIVRAAVISSRQGKSLI
jgi:hypothetical protein